jgi:hypothetical protein
MSRSGLIPLSPPEIHSLEYGFTIFHVSNLQMLIHWGNWNFDPTQIESLYVRGNTVINPLLPGIQVYSLEDTVFSNNTVLSPTTQGIVIGQRSDGVATFSNNTVSELRPTSEPFENDSTSFAASGRGISGFTP